ncbi:hypothetical protein H6G76_02010 [Nostoc sp. FACHB-152]|uniref:hypothetical protein n=1 Tax=unclassified Nostoc TaxID=2593658 RepID=UPI0016872B54|nr:MULTISPECIES: hypothetical protein [unclassified Nostoc]MBD2445947.1 hypothetical protein [Nostoc sp. FACHB-152]MBD2467877.1 hypothetical protein [Nostoc sp. FACHB-145]
MSKPEQPSEQEKHSEKQMIVEGLLIVFLLLPSLLFIFSMVITDYLAERPPIRSLDDAARNSKALACELRKQNEGGDSGDCRK